MEDRLIQKGLVLFLMIWAASAPVMAREWVVEVKDGRPTPSLEQIGSQLSPGDRVILSPPNSTVRAALVLKNLRGTADNPIVIEGNNCTLLGTEPLLPGEWVEVEPGLYRSEALAQRLRVNDNLLQRWYFVFDGVIQRMGRVSKGRQPALPPVDKLQAGEWTFDARGKAFVLRLIEGQSLNEVEASERQSGVAISGMDSAHLEIRDLTVKHFFNDGFNIHGKCEAVRFVNIAALFCGDDGFSAHEDCSVEAIGFRAEGNATGFCNVNRSRFVAERVELVRNLAYDVYVTDSSQNSVEGLKVENVASKAIVTRGSEKDPAPCRLFVQNAELKGVGQIMVGKQSIFEAEGLSAEGSSWDIVGEAKIRNSRLSGEKFSIVGEWVASDNVYAFPSFLFRGKPVTEFSAYQQSSGQDAGSVRLPASP